MLLLGTRSFQAQLAAFHTKHRNQNTRTLSNEYTNKTATLIHLKWRQSQYNYYYNIVESAVEKIAAFDRLHYKGILKLRAKINIIIYWGAFSIDSCGPKEKYPPVVCRNISVTCVLCPVLALGLTVALPHSHARVCFCLACSWKVNLMLSLSHC